MKLKINGEPREIDNAGTVAELVSALELPSQTLLVEHNGLALRRDEWPGRALNEGDQIEFLRIAAGG